MSDGHPIKLELLKLIQPCAAHLSWLGIVFD
jgi:hypothetical protein